MLKPIILALLLTSLLGLPSAFAVPLCTSIFSRPEESARPTLQDLALESPEIEAKFLIPNRDVFERLKLLVGREIKLKDIDGQWVTYRVEKNKEHIYEDTNLDTKDLALFQRRGMLRQRIRHDRNPETGKYKFSKAVFQAKNGPIDNQGMNEAVYARNEIRGTEFKKLKKFEKNRKELLGTESRDEAVNYAREYSGSDKKFKPVLEIKDTRFFMKFTRKQGPSEGVPEFYVSLDDVQYRGLIGAQGKARRLELEAEIIDDLTLDSAQVGQAKLVLMNGLSEYLKQEFGLPESPESKYESGVKLTILPQNEERH